MRFLNGLAFAGLAGLATAATSEPAQVYILSANPPPAHSSSLQPQIPRQVARQIFLQRLSGQTRLDDLPNSITDDDALSYIAQYGKAPKSLFGDASSGTMDPSQLLVLLEGVPDDLVAKIPGFMEAQNFKPAFTITDTPSAKAHDHLVDIELSEVSGSCSLEAAIDPYDNCWGGKMSLAVKYDAIKDTSSLNYLMQDLSILRQSVADNVLEATLVILPQSTRQSKHAYWTTNAPSELRRRFIEAPISDAVSKVVVAPGSGGAVAEAADPSSKMNLGCFSSHNSCVSTTSNCTGHGTCVDKYAIPGQGSGDKQCFVCSCLSTLTHPDKENGGKTHWGGAYCQKIDVSSPFWLLFGTSFILVGLVTGCIVMLFSVGEEKLPGVIGAGVSRSK